MANNTIEQLSAFFLKFPGIGRRQARRFVYYLLSENPDTLERLAYAISHLKDEITQCPRCQRFFPQGTTVRELCSLCNNPERDHNTLLVVEKDTDLENIEKTDTYHGDYFVLGGLIPVLEEPATTRVRSQSLETEVKRRIEARELQEIILALSANAEGDNTARFLRSLLEPTTSFYSVNISVLGRGLSTGTELEYSDRDTLLNALQNRH